MALLNAFHYLRLVHHQVKTTGRGKISRRGQTHARDSPTGALFKGTKQRFHELPVQQKALCERLRLVVGSKIWRHEGIGKLRLTH